MNAFELMVKRAEKLCSAAYKVSEFMPTDEPIRASLRSGALAILSDISHMLGLDIAPDHKRFRRVLGSIDAILALLRVSRRSGLLSEMNAAILCDSYSSLRDSITKTPDFSSYSLTLGEIIRPDEDLYYPRISPGSLKDKTVHPKQADKQVSHKGRKDRFGAEMDGSSLDGEAGRDTRKSSILEFLRGHGEASIKDIFKIPTLAKGYSEKTIQRELASLVNAGAIRKQGERRWSRYSLSS